MTPSQDVVLSDALLRFSKWKNPSPSDTARILGPALRGLCLDAGVPETHATEWLQAAEVTEENVRAFVRSIEEANTLACARARQKQIDREVRTNAIVDPEETGLPITERSESALKTRAARLYLLGSYNRPARKERLDIENELARRWALADGLPFEPRTMADVAREDSAACLGAAGVR